MKQAILLHNPGAGDEDHLKSDLVECIENEGYTCVYFSVKKETVGFINWIRQTLQLWQAEMEQ